MQDILLYFIKKYNHNWDHVYQAIANKELIDNQVLKEFKKQTHLPLISIINDYYPKVFKEMYMPPLAFLYEGNLKLFDEKIIGIYGKIEKEHLAELKKLSQYQYVFCVCEHDLDLEVYLMMLKANFKIIILSQKPLKDLEKYPAHINTLKWTENVFSHSFNPSSEQTLNRIFYATSTKILLINQLINTLKIVLEHHQNSPKPCYIIERNELNGWMKEFVNQQLIFPIKKVSEIILQKS